MFCSTDEALSHRWVRFSAPLLPFALSITFSIETGLRRLLHLEMMPHLNHGVNFHLAIRYKMLSIDTRFEPGLLPLCTRALDCQSLIRRQVRRWTWELEEGEKVHTAP